MSYLKILSVYDCLFLRKAKFMFKVFNDITPAYISENFTRGNAVSNNNSTILGSSTSGCFIPPKSRTECFRNSMRYSGCLIWNSLPDVIKCAPTLESFHNRFIRWLVTD